MNKKLEVVQDKFLGYLSQMSDTFGLNGFVAQIYGFLYLNTEPVSLDEITQALGASKGNVSINIRELEKWGAVRKVWVKGSRKDYYEVEPDIKKIFVNKIKSTAQKRLAEISEVLAEANKIIGSANGELSAEEKKLAKGYMERFKKIEELKNQVSSAIGLFDRFL